MCLSLAFSFSDSTSETIDWSSLIFSFVDLNDSSITDESVLGDLVGLFFSLMDPFLVSVRGPA